MTGRFRWVGIALSAIIGVIMIALAVIWVRSNAILHKTYDVTVETVAFPAPDSAVLARGEHLVKAVVLCGDCHGQNLAGTWIMDDPSFARLRAANITPAGKGGTYSDADWVRLLRHGVKPNGQSAVVMPAESYRYLTDADLAAVVAYVRSVPPAEGSSDGLIPGPISRMLLTMGPLRAILVAPRIAADTMAMPTETTPDTTAGYGYYLVHTAGCIGCHGDHLSGGPIPGGDPNSPPAANITPGGIGSWAFADFERALRTGVGMAGRQIDPGMPRRAQMTDLELTALWKYLHSIPARELGT